MIEFLLMLWLLASFGDNPSRRGPASPPPAPRRRAATDEVDRSRIVAAIGALGWPAREVDRTIGIESGWNPAARNPASDASGLLQFLPSTLRMLGYDGTPAEFRALAPLEQLPWMLAYFGRITKRWRHPGDTYLAVAYPRFVGAPDDAVVDAVGSPGWRLNKSFRTAGNGPVTAGSVRSVLTQRVEV